MAMGGAPYLSMEGLDGVGDILLVMPGQPGPDGQRQDLIGGTLAQWEVTARVAVALHVWPVQMDGRRILGMGGDTTLVEVALERVAILRSDHVAHPRVVAPLRLGRQLNGQVAPEWG